MSGLSMLCLVLFFNIFLGSYMAMQVSLSNILLLEVELRWDLVVGINWKVSIKFTSLIRGGTC